MSNEDQKAIDGCGEHWAMAVERARDRVLKAHPEARIDGFGYVVCHEGNLGYGWLDAVFNLS
jgi:hypothetical protein